MGLRLPPLDTKIPAWDLDDLIERSCPICTTNDASTVNVRPDGLNVRICRKCLTFFVSPSPSDEQLQALYREYDEKYRGRLDVSAKKLAASYEGVDPLSDLRIRELSSLMRFEGSRVLDIGFGRAYFLYCLKTLGAIPYGLELDTQAIEFARSLGIEHVFHGNISDVAWANQFDLIALVDFIEHPMDPMHILRRSAELLQRGGFLMLWTPNGDQARREEHPTTFRIDLEHMQYFTPETCLFVASELELRVVHLETIGFPWLQGMDKRSATSSSEPLIKRTIKSLPGYSTLNSLRQKVFGNILYDRSGGYHLFCIMQKPT